MRRRQLLLSVLAIGAVAPATAAADGGPIMPLSQVQPGMDCTGETVVKGTTISPFDVQVVNVVQAPGEGPRILVKVAGPAVDATGIAEGFSGSPVYCPGPDGTMENAGAVSEGIGSYGNKEGLVTPIEQMLGEPVRPPSHARRLAAKRRPLLGPLTVAGLSPALFHVLQLAGERAGRPVAAAPAGPFTAFPIQPLVPGASVAVSYATGTIAIGAVGTVTYRDGPIVYAFGHPLDDAGRRSLLLQDAYVYDVISNPDPSIAPSYKLAAPGHVEGTLTSDTPAAVLGQVGPAPALIPINITVHDLDTGRVIREQSQVADETDVGLPVGSSLLDTVAPLAVGQAATDIYNGAPANESGRMCFTVEIRELRTPLRFCNRYVGTGSSGGSPFALPLLANASATDATTAFGALEAEQFAKLHVRSVTASIWAQRGLAQGTIVSAHAPRRAKAGRTVIVHLRVRQFRGPLVTVSFQLQIPRRARGPLRVTIHGPSFPQPGASSGGGQSLAAALASALSGSSGPSGPPPRSFAELRKHFAAVGTYDGLEARFSSPHTSARVFTDPSLLISGQARLALFVGR